MARIKYLFFVLLCLFFYFIPNMQTKIKTSLFGIQFFFLNKLMKLIVLFPNKHIVNLTFIVNFVSLNYKPFKKNKECRYCV